MSDSVSIIGAGSVGFALGATFSRAGIDVTFGTRNPGDDVPSGTAKTEVANAILANDVVVLAIPGGAVQAFVDEHGEALAGKLVIDATNPLVWDGGPVWNPPAQGSNAQLLATTGANVVKGFNTFGAEFHASPSVGGDRVEVFLAGADHAVERVAALAERAGYRPTAAGPLRNASVLENMAMLWIHLALAAGHGRDFVIQRVG